MENSPDAINEKYAALCRERIVLQVGPMDDLPPQLQDTITSFYCHLVKMEAAVNSQDPAGGATAEIAAGLSSYIENKQWWDAMVEQLPHIVHILRKIDREKEPGSYAETAEYLCDHLTCDIGRFTGNLPPFMRKKLVRLKKRMYTVVPGIADQILRNEGQASH